MGSVEQGCCARRAASRPGPEPPAITFLNQILPSKQAGRQALAEALARHSRTFVSSWLSQQPPCSPLSSPVRNPGAGAPGRGAAPRLWLPSPLAISPGLSLAFKAPGSGLSPSPSDIAPRTPSPPAGCCLSLHTWFFHPGIPWRGANRARAMEGWGQPQLEQRGLSSEPLPEPSFLP